MAKDEESEIYSRNIRILREAKSKYREELLKHPNIHGIGIGYKRTNGKKTDKLCIVIHVHRKLPLDRVRKSRLIPKEFRFYSNSAESEITVLTDVQEVVPAVPEVDCDNCTTNLEARVRPIPGGYSIGLPGQGGGTLGGWVWDKTNENFVLLSNEHVLGSTAGDHVIQPSSIDGGSDPADHFADVVRSGTLDVAIAEPLGSSDARFSIACDRGPAVYEITAAVVDMEIEKVGQTTGLTCGIVDLIDYDTGHYGSTDDLYILGDGADFSDFGDSGSLYLEKTNPNSDEKWKRVVGIHWGGGGDNGVGHPIGTVFRDLDLATVCTGLIEVLFDTMYTSHARAEFETVIGSKRIIRKKQVFSRNIAKDFQKAMLIYPLGKKIVELVSRKRADIVNFLLDNDGWRSTIALLKPVLSKVVTIEDMLEYRITDIDIENFARVIKVAQKVKPEMEEMLDFAKNIMSQATGKKMKDIMSGKELPM